MAEFWVYDVIFLVLFSLFTFYFLRKKRSSLSKEGIIFLYRTKFGIKAIKAVGDKYKRFLYSIRYVVIGWGIILMAGMLWMLWRTLSLYIFYPDITKVIKAPPIAPLIPYFPKLFGMSSFFPPFYFTYFIGALAIVAVAHEFSHGIFMRVFKIKIKSTGLVFLGPILGAFVEEEKKNFEKKKKTEQMTVLGAGVFANSVMSLLFYIIYVLFFISAFVPSGYIFSSYSLSSVPASAIKDTYRIENFTAFDIDSKTYLLDENLKKQLELNQSQIIAYDYAPAILSGISGAIVKADDFEIKNVKDLQSFLKSKRPGEKATIYTTDGENIKKYEVTLASNPNNPEVAFLGVGHSEPNPKGLISKLFAKLMSFKDPSTFYKPKIDGNLLIFILNFIWWIMVINLLVALFNMLPLGILDGGRFFYLLIWGITGSEKFGRQAYKYIGYLILASFILMMIYWGMGVF